MKVEEQSTGEVVPNSDVAEEQGADIGPVSPAASRPRRLSWGLLGGIAGFILLAFYVLVLAHRQVDALTENSGIPASLGGWKAIAALLALSLVAVAGAAAYSSRLSASVSARWLGTHVELTAVVAITAGALGLRVFGISDNLPYISNPDEPAIADKALRILQSGDFNPHYFVYPNLYYYMQAALYAVRFLFLVSSGRAETIGAVVSTDFYLWGRLLSALLGTLTVLLVYIAGKRLYGGVVGLVAAVFMAANSIHIINSQVITTDVAATFFCALALVTSLRLLPPDVGVRSPIGETSRWAPGQGRLAPIASYVIAGAAVGLATGSKYNAALAFLPLLLAHAFAVMYSGRRGNQLVLFFGGRLWVALGATVAAFILTTPFAVFDMPHFLNDVASVIAHYRFGHQGHEGDTNWLYYVSHFLATDTVATALTLVGVAFAFVRHRKADVLVLAFPLALYWSMSNYRVNFDQNLLPLLPFTSILAALPLVGAFEWLRTRWIDRQSAPLRRRLTTGALLMVALVALVGVWPSTASALQRDYKQTQPDNRLRAARWLDANTSPGTKVWLEPLTPPLDPGRYLTGHGDHVTDHPMDWYVANRYEYLVLSAGAYKDVVYDNPDKDRALRSAYLAFFEQNKSRLAAEFETNKIDHPGPTILIYRTGYTPPAAKGDVRSEHPIKATFREQGPTGSDIELVGSDYPDTVQAGTTLPLVLYWAADKTPGGDYTVFVHLANASGATQAQRDTGPRSGTYPTSLWKPGEVVVDEAGLDLPTSLAPGLYTLRVGLYLQSGGKAQAAFKLTEGPTGSGPDYVVLGPIRVQAPAK